MSITIAIAEDSPLLLAEFVHIFSRDGYLVVVQAENGQVLVDEIAELPALPDICFTDIRMPVMDGFETIQVLKAKYPSLKILATSSDHSASMVRAVMRCGADDFVKKADLAMCFAKIERLVT